MKSAAMVLYVLLAISCRDSHHKAEKDEVRKVIEDIIAADNRSDIVKVLAIYADDAVLMPPGKPAIVGRTAIENNYKQIFESSTLQLHTTIEDVILSEQRAVAIGTNNGRVILKKDDSSRAVNDKYVMLLEKDAHGNWRIKRLIWNANN